MFPSKYKNSKCCHKTTECKEPCETKIDKCPCPINYYLFIYKSTNQQYTGTGFMDVLFNNVGASNGWMTGPISSTGFADFIVPATGLYEISYTATVTNTGTFSEVDVLIPSPKQDVIFQLQDLTANTPIVASESWSTVDESAITLAPRIIRPTYEEISNTFFATLQAGHHISLQTSGTSAFLSLNTSLPSLGLTNLRPVKLEITSLF